MLLHQLLQLCFQIASQTFTRSPSSSLHSNLSSANQFSRRFFLFWFTTRRDNSNDSNALSFPLVKSVPKYCNKGGVCPACTGTLCNNDDRKLNQQYKFHVIPIHLGQSFMLIDSIVSIRELNKLEKGKENLKLGHCIRCAEQSLRRLSSKFSSLFILCLCKQLLETLHNLKNPRWHVSSYLLYKKNNKSNGYMFAWISIPTYQSYINSWILYPTSLTKSVSPTPGYNHQISEVRNHATRTQPYIHEKQTSKLLSSCFILAISMYNIYIASYTKNWRRKQ